MQFENEKQNDLRLELICECCGKKYDRWEIDMVKPTADFILQSPDFNFACPLCVTKFDLVPIQTTMAKIFRKRNEKIRLILTSPLIQ